MAEVPDQRAENRVVDAVELLVREWLDQLQGVTACLFQTPGQLGLAVGSGTRITLRAGCNNLRDRSRLPGSIARPESNIVSGMGNGRAFALVAVAALTCALVVGPASASAHEPGAVAAKKCKKKPKRAKRSAAAEAKKRKRKCRRIKPPTPAAALSITPTSHDFGDAPAVSPPFDFVVTNVGGQFSGVPAVSLGGSTAIDFEITANTCTAGLAPSAACTISVRAVDNAGGNPATAVLNVLATPGGAASAALQVTYI
jgi:hypothetical protein